MKGTKYTMKSSVWLYPGMAGWHFVDIGKKHSKEIKLNRMPFRKGFGSVPVSVTAGKTKWETSIFPNKSGVYVLPLKKEVRKKENISVGDIIKFSIEMRE